MDPNKKQKIVTVLGGAAAVGTAFAGIGAGVLSFYQLHILRKQAKAEMAALENKDHE